MTTSSAAGRTRRASGLPSATSGAGTASAAPPDGGFTTAFGSWLAGSGLSEAEVARQLRVDGSQVNRWKTGESRPQYRTIKGIKALSGGAVTEADWPIETLRQRRRKK